MKSFGETEYWKTMEREVGAILEPLLGYDGPGLGLEYHVPVIEDLRLYPDAAVELRKYLLERFSLAPSGVVMRTERSILAFWERCPAPEVW